MSVFSPAARLAALAAATVAAVVVVGAQGCSKSSAIPGVHASASPGVTPSPSPVASGGSPTPTPSPTPRYFVAIVESSPTVDPTYGPVEGMSLIPGPVVSPSPSTNPFATPGPSSIILVLGGQNKIRFYNYDSLQRTASNNGALPTPGATWPPTFVNPNGAQTASAPGSFISDSPLFSTGTLAAGSLTAPTASADYFTGAPGMYFMADAYSYNPVPPYKQPLRTIFIVF
jgi:hypothetical protein